MGSGQGRVHFVIITHFSEGCLEMKGGWNNIHRCANNSQTPARALSESFIVFVSFFLITSLSCGNTRLCLAVKCSPISKRCQSLKPEAISAFRTAFTFIFSLPVCLVPPNSLYICVYVEGRGVHRTNVSVTHTGDRSKGGR